FYWYLFITVGALHPMYYHQYLPVQCPVYPRISAIINPMDLFTSSTIWQTIYDGNRPKTPFPLKNSKAIIKEFLMI
ncbi:MAG: hypothetical protein AB1779_06535, partial [Candidatus Thermoplasmatota archaeon]